MARLIGERPRYKGEALMYDFVMKELPDYIYAKFEVVIGETEMDLILFVPHMGVFIIDIFGGELYTEQDRLFVRRSDGMNYPFKPRSMGVRHEIGAVKDLSRYLDGKFGHARPFVYYMYSFTSVHKDTDVYRLIDKIYGADRVICREDIDDHQQFLLKLHLGRICFFRMLERVSGRMDDSCNSFDRVYYYDMRHTIREKNDGMEDPEDMSAYTDPRRYTDLSDTMAYNFFHYWETGMKEPSRPPKPPIVFMSYCTRNSNMAMEIKGDLEQRGIFTWRAPEDVPISGDYLTKEMKAIEDCDAFLLLLSSASQESLGKGGVKDEFEKALENKKTIIPIKIEDFDVNDYYTKALSHIQYRVMTKLDPEVMREIEYQIRNSAEDL